MISAGAPGVEGGPSVYRASPSIASQNNESVLWTLYFR